MNDAIKDPAYWRERAAQTRTKAEGIRISEVERKRLLRIADEYEHLAQHAENWRTARNDKGTLA